MFNGDKSIDTIERCVCRPITASITASDKFFYRAGQQLIEVDVGSSSFTHSVRATSESNGSQSFTFRCHAGWTGVGCNKLLVGAD